MLQVLEAAIHKAMNETPIAIKTCNDNSISPLLYSAKQLVTNSLQHLQSAPEQSSKGAPGARNATSGVTHALHTCLAVACNCYFTLMYGAPLV
jgi:hypothetical protein